MKKNAGNMVWYIIKLLLVGYIISGIILGVLALMMWKGNPAGRSDKRRTFICLSYFMFCRRIAFG